jgi:hypothetical protein
MDRDFLNLDGVTPLILLNVVLNVDLDLKPTSFAIPNSVK